MAKSNTPKTVPTGASVDDFLAGQADPGRQADCQALVQMMQAATGQPPVMWGSAIVGFGTYRQTYASGTTSDWPVVGFSPRKNDLTVYLMPGFDRLETLLHKLGKHKTGQVCLYIKRLADVDRTVLQALVEASVAAMADRRIT